MDPLSAAASVLTVLGAAGGSVKFLHAFIINFEDAPSEIKKQVIQLETLGRSISQLIKLYNGMAQDCQLDSDVVKAISDFEQEASSVRTGLEEQIAKMDKSRGHRLKGKLKWVIFDHKLKRFLSSVDSWNIVISQAATWSQLYVLSETIF